MINDIWLLIIRFALLWGSNHTYRCLRLVSKAFRDNVDQIFLVPRFDRYVFFLLLVHSAEMISPTPPIEELRKGFTFGVSYKKASDPAFRRRQFKISVSLSPNKSFNGMLKLSKMSNKRRVFKTKFFIKACFLYRLSFIFQLILHLFSGSPLTGNSNYCFSDVGVMHNPCLFCALLVIKTMNKSENIKIEKGNKISSRRIVDKNVKPEENILFTLLDDLKPEEISKVMFLNYVPSEGAINKAKLNVRVHLSRSSLIKQIKDFWNQDTAIPPAHNFGPVDQLVFEKLMNEFKKYRRSKQTVCLYDIKESFANKLNDGLRVFKHRLSDNSNDEFVNDPKGEQDRSVYTLKNLIWDSMFKSADCPEHVRADVGFLIICEMHTFDLLYIDLALLSDEYFEESRPTREYSDSALETYPLLSSIRVRILSHLPVYQDGSISWATEGPLAILRSYSVKKAISVLIRQFKRHSQKLNILEKLDEIANNKTFSFYDYY